MEIIQGLKNKIEELHDRYVHVVLLPTPPTPVDNIMFMPDCFASKTFDEQLDRPDEFKLISMKATKFGPAILAMVKFNRLIDLNDDGMAYVESATCCASVSFTVLLDADGLRYADNTSIDGIRLISQSCHPGSHFVIPNAPYFTSLLHYSLAPEWDLEKNELRHEGRNLGRFTYMTPWEASDLFDNCDFTDNLQFDIFLAKCAIGADSTYCKVHGGLGKWARPYIKHMRNNLLQINDLEYQQWRKRPYKLFS